MSESKERTPRKKMLEHSDHIPVLDGKQTLDESRNRTSLRHLRSTATNEINNNSALSYAGRDRGGTSTTIGAGGLEEDEDERMTSRRRSTRQSSSDLQEMLTSSLTVNNSPSRKAPATEVIVHHGENTHTIQEVRVVFTPHPPSQTRHPSVDVSDDIISKSPRPAPYIRSLSSSSSSSAAAAGRPTEHRRNRSAFEAHWRQRRITGTPSQVTDDDSIPYSTEESSATRDITNINLMTSAAAADYSNPTSEFMGCLGLPMTSSSGSNDAIEIDLAHAHTEKNVAAVAATAVSDYRSQSVDRQIRRDIINGLNYLEQRKDELSELNKRLRLDIERLNRSNDQLRAEILENERRYKQLEIENEEIKIALDSSEKEKARLNDQVIQEWNARVKAEELYMEARRDGEVRVKEFKQQLDAATAVVSTRHTDNELDAYKAQTLELQHQVAALEYMVKRINSEHDHDITAVARLDNEIVDWKARFETKCRDFDVQVGRFLMLKKSFNELHAENERLKKNGRIAQRCGVGDTGPGKRRGPNLTWPTNVATTESIRVIDLTEQFIASNNGTTGNVAYVGGAGAFIGGNATFNKSPRGSMSESLGGSLPKVLQARLRKKSEDASASVCGENLPPILTGKLQNI